jgi:ATP-dependent exoDNAse (exonuclease V) alpha subunit
MSISDHFKGQELTNDQKELLVELESFIEAPHTHAFILKGFAGTGKSYIMAGVTRYLSWLGKEFVIIAPTGKAAKVIATKTKFKASTIHRVIYKFYENDEEPKSEYLDRKPETFSYLYDNSDEPDTIYIVDESSMISDRFSTSHIGKFGSGYLLQDLMEYIDFRNNPRRKVIFIGDNAQLPPINNSYSPALCEHLLRVVYKLQCQSFELTEVVRQKSESGVMKNAQALRDAMETRKATDFEFDASSQDVNILPSGCVVSKYFELCEGRIENTNNQIIIARTNKKVYEYVCDIRAKLFTPSAPVQVNETVMCAKNFKTTNSFISNGELGRVTRVLSGVECRKIYVLENLPSGVLITPVELQFLDLEIEFKDDYGKPLVITKKVLLNLMYNPAPRLEGTLYQALRADFNKRFFTNHKSNGDSYEEVKRVDPYLNCLHLKFGYAITCHKSQGSEWPHVFVDAYNSGKITSDYRWLYTAITRTTDRLYICQ